MPHDKQKRREAAAMPLILFGEYGRTVEGYRPADEDLTRASAGEAAHTWQPVEGPHLRCVRGKDCRNQTGVVGVSYTRITRYGRRRSYYVVNLGSTSRRFCLETLGRSEAWRRAVTLRHAHEQKVAQANAVILAARARNETAIPIGGAR